MRWHSSTTDGSLARDFVRNLGFGQQWAEDRSDQPGMASGGIQNTGDDGFFELDVSPVGQALQHGTGILFVISAQQEGVGRNQFIERFQIL